MPTAAKAFGQPSIIQYSSIATMDDVFRLEINYNIAGRLFFNAGLSGRVHPHLRQSLYTIYCLDIPPGSGAMLAVTVRLE